MDFMREFRPRETTIQLHTALAVQLEQLDRRIKTSNNIAGKQLAEHLMPIMLGFHQWILSQSTDLADYAQSIASRLDGGFSDDDFEILSMVHSHLEELQKLFEEMKEILPPNVVALGERNKELLSAMNEMIESSDEEQSADIDEPLFEDEPSEVQEDEVIK